MDRQSWGRLNNVDAASLETNAIGNFDKYNYEFGQIQLAILRNTFDNFAKIYGQAILGEG